jgi:hypothetical protein
VSILAASPTLVAMSLSDSGNCVANMVMARRLERVHSVGIIAAASRDSVDLCPTKDFSHSPFWCAQS